MTQRAHTEWGKGNFCNKRCARRYYLATHSTCHETSCRREFVHRKIGSPTEHALVPRTRPRYCSRACLYRAQRVEDVRSTPAARRIFDAHKLGIRGSRGLARAAGASTKTVYRVCAAIGVEVGSDEKPNALHEVIVGDLRVSVVADKNFDVTHPVAWRAGQRFASLHPGEWVILERLARSPGEIVTSEELLAGWDGRRAKASSNRSLATYVAGLRRKLDVTIKSSPGIGYRLELPR